MNLSLNGIHLWIIFGFFAAVFLLGFFYRISVWLRGGVEVEGQPFIEENNTRKKSGSYKFLKYAGFFTRAVFSKKIFIIFKSFIRDGIIHFNLLKDSRLKWFIHIFMFWGLTVFFIISVLHFISVAAAPGGIPVENSSGFVKIFGTLENRFTAFTLDISKLAIIFGAVIAVLRFLIFKNKIKSVELKDKSAGIFLSCIAILGFLYEASYFTAQAVPLEKSIFAPAGFILSLIFFYININWWIATVIFFNIYFAALFAFVAFIPYGKYSHMVFGPVVAVYNKLAAPSTEKKISSQYET
jgi:heterodisulfide reductase subunit E